MISSPRLSTGRASSTDGPAAAATAAPANSTDDAAAPFDSVLALETQAASDPSLEGTALNATGTPELDDSALTSTDDTDSDDLDASETEGPLAFLASLLNAAAVTAAAPGAGSGNSGGEQDASDDALGVCAKPVAATLPDATAGAAAQSGNAGAAAAVADPALAAKLLSQQAANADLARDPSAARTDAASGVASDASAQGAARAAEMFAHNLRHPLAGSERNEIATPVRDPRWADDLGTRVALMVRGGESSASLQLSPVDLGPLDVNVTVRDSQASIHFGAAHAETRALLEASIPRLREMLAAQGFQLMDASVSQGFARQARPQPTVQGRPDAEPEIEVRATPGVRLSGLLDTYA